MSVGFEIEFPRTRAEKEMARTRVGKYSDLRCRGVKHPRPGAQGRKKNVQVYKPYDGRIKKKIKRFRQKEEGRFGTEGGRPKYVRGVLFQTMFLGI